MSSEVIPEAAVEAAAPYIEAFRRKPFDWAPIIEEWKGRWQG